MYIKEIVIDGFKSYAQRTEVKGFDPLFNAITGLNGSGKSNILDSICFLLGISNLSQVRAGSLQELVYKGGQAGVTKATVTITFDNRDKKQSPVGYESFSEITVSRQVVVGGRNKYLINGSNANNSRVQDLFCSVQLNVNNPHFLIMQGRITKVLNMKPPEVTGSSGTLKFYSQFAQSTLGIMGGPLDVLFTWLEISEYNCGGTAKYQRVAKLLLEYDQRTTSEGSIYHHILSMIEEAAGTRMYENKKATAQRTIEKKDMKLKEIESIMAEEITPTLTRLKEERSSYLEYQKVMRELEHLGRLHIAYQFVGAEQMSKSSAEELAKMTEATQMLRNRMKEIGDKISELATVIQNLEKQRDEEAGGALQELEKKLGEKQNADTKMQSSVKNQKELLNKEKKNKKAIEKGYYEDQATLKEQEKAIEKNSANFAKLEQKCSEDLAGVTTAQKHFQAVSAGLSSNDDGQDATLADQLMACKGEMNQADTNIKQSQMKLKSEQAELKKKQSELKKTEKDYKKDSDNLSAVQKSKAKLEAEMKKLGYVEGKEDDLVNRRGVLSEKVNGLNDVVGNLTARFPNLQFDYKNPEKNFDRSKVHGLLARLVKVNDVRNATALEVTAGRKLYNVVVDTEVTGKKLLQKGELKRRYTIIPLNKISARSLAPDRVKAAERLVGKENVHTALSLVGYEKDIESAVQFVFGGSFVCNKTEHAKKVTFDPNVKTRTVTLAGDTFDPSGTLTGGARAKGSTILAKLSELQDAEMKLKEASKELQDVDTQLNTLRASADKFNQLKEQYDLKVHEADLLQERVQQGSHHKQLEDIQALEASIAEQDEAISAAKGKQKELSEKCKTLESKIKDAKAHREKELKTAEQEVTKAKKKAEESNKTMKVKQQEMESLRLEVEGLKQGLGKNDDQLKAVDEAIEGIDQQLKEMEEAAKVTKDAVKEAKKELDGQKAVLKECNADIQKRIGEQQDAMKEDQDTQLQIKEMEHTMAKYQRDSKDAANKVENLLAKYEWIATEKQYFGQANTAYDFTNSDPKDVARRLQKLQETKEKLSKNVNMRAMNMFSKAEEKYTDLMKKKKIVENDKQKIMATIRELDEKKNEALKTAWSQVNKDFGSIFAMLLPGTSAKLTPPEGKSILDGLEVKVAFGDVWKESLTELSGGQRSLVALSLILSLLLFKPAPLYILDEVDAALDLSHTQNIGQMLRTHFRKSQFIVVSLKDGMFNNANVLFKTKFVDGISTVTRYAQSQSNRTTSSSSVGGSAVRGGKSTAKKGTSKRARLEPIGQNV